MRKQFLGGKIMENNQENNFQRLFNFDNIGTKIKNFTKWYCWVSIVLMWIGAVILFFVGTSDDDVYFLMAIALGMAVIMPFAIWISSWVMYAFGELVESTMEMRDNSKKQLKEINKSILKTPTILQQTNDIATQAPIVPDELPDL